MMDWQTLDIDCRLFYEFELVSYDC